MEILSARGAIMKAEMSMQNDTGLTSSGIRIAATPSGPVDPSQEGTYRPRR